MVDFGLGGEVLEEREVGSVCGDIDAVEEVGEKWGGEAADC